MANEPDDTLAIIEESGRWIVCEGGVRISKPFEDKTEAEWWAWYHKCWRQPKCIGCGSAVGRPDDPWETYSVSCSFGPDWMHRSCLKRLVRETELER
jgi:hypothetical protein